MKKLLFACCMAWLVAACAGNPFNGRGVEPGTPGDALIARWGQPTRVVRLPVGERMQYSMQPFGQSAWMVDLDAAGRVVRSRQVLTAAEFNRIDVGKWTRDDVEREFGPPAKIDAVASWNGPIMTYRWNDGSDMLYFVYLDSRGVAQRAHPGMEFFNAPDRE